MKTENHYDTFDGAVINSAIWASQFGTVGFNLGDLQLTVAAGGANYEGLTGVGGFDLTSSYSIMEVTNAGNQALVSLEVYPLQLCLDSSNKLSWLINQNFISCYKVVAGVSTQIGANTAYLTGVHRFFRIREADGVVYWDYSSDRIDWVNFRSELVSNLFDITNLFCEPAAGVYASELSGSTVRFNNYNITKKGESPTFVKRLRPAIFTPSRAR
jgi:hypothetical protein